MDQTKTYIAIDLKSFYASVECVQRHLDPLTTNLVVADASRTEKTICLAVTPSLKSYGISGRARLFEVIQKIKEINADRLQTAIKSNAIQQDEKGQYQFSGSSFDAPALASDPSLELAYITAPPRMKLYEEISARIISTYLKYVSKKDIHVYSIDEVFIDVTGYLATYRLSAHELAMTMIREVLYTTGITATAGIGTNLYLAKIAMDIVAKKVLPDKDGVRIAELDERSYRELLWCHTPLTDFWRVGQGISKRLAKLNCYTMGDVARLSVHAEDLLYRTLGVNAELLIDHAWGWEPTTMEMIQMYRPHSNSLSSGQVLSEPYSFEKGRIIVQEMTELLVLDLVRKGVVTKQVTLTISYDRTSLSCTFQGRSIADSVYIVSTTGERYKGKVQNDYYGRPAPVHAHGTGNLDRWTCSTRRIMDVMMKLYDRIVDPDLLIRRVNVVAAELLNEKKIPIEDTHEEQLSLLVDYEKQTQDQIAEELADARERSLQEATLELKARYGKNAVLKGINLLDGATTIIRNGQIGGHRANSPTMFTADKKKTVTVDKVNNPQTGG